MNTLVKNVVLAPFNLLYRISPETTLKVLFRLKVGYPLNLEHPKGYNEKIQWIKLYDRNSLMPKCCDKYAVRKYVESKGCGNLLNDLLWQGFNPAEIPFDELPERYVVKVTHGSTFNVIVDGKHPVNRDEVVAKCQKWLKARFLPCYGEWFYGVEKPRVVVEKYLENEGSGQLYDYKVYCFNGIARYIRIDIDRFSDHKMLMYDRDWNRLTGYGIRYQCAEVDFPKPNCLTELLSAAEKLSDVFTHARVDFYIVNESPIFGEITFTSGAGFDRFHPEEFDYEMGSWLSLPKRKRASMNTKVLVDDPNPKLSRGWDCNRHPGGLR